MVQPKRHDREHTETQSFLSLVKLTTSFSGVLPSSQLGYFASKPVQSMVYCLKKHQTNPIAQFVDTLLLIHLNIKRGDSWVKGLSALSRFQKKKRICCHPFETFFCRTQRCMIPRPVWMTRTVLVVING